jgi:hypothetical protein
MTLKNIFVLFALMFIFLLVGGRQWLYVTLEKLWGDPKDLGKILP